LFERVAVLLIINDYQKFFMH
jgi:hypothetical protein